MYQFLDIADAAVDTCGEVGFGPGPSAIAATLAAGHSNVSSRTELVVGGIADSQVPWNRHPRLGGAGLVLLYHEDLRDLLAGGRYALTPATVIGAMLPTSNDQ